MEYKEIGNQDNFFPQFVMESSEYSPNRCFFSDDITYRFTLHNLAYGSKTYICF